jgi:ribosomal-protein-serine acetyltransferase
MLTMAVDAETALGLLEERHAEALFRLTDANRAYLREWLPWLDHVREAGDTLEFIRANLRQLAENNGFSLGIFHGGTLAGVLGLHAIHWPHRTTSIGYWLGAAFQGRGLVTRSCARLLDHVFDELGLNLAEIRCAPGNRRSRAIPERLGFRKEGLLRQREWLYDHHVDHVVYGMLAAEWRARRGA